MKRNFIIGTSGHVDHGKTALIKALTGKDLDTHKEEKKRGITINNGYTHLQINDFNVGVIDVPGHRDFISNMIAGATGIDVAMLVIAANSGPEKQTEEHLKILEMLDVSSVIIVLTKCDLVEEDELEMSKELILDLCGDSELKNAPMVEVSALKGTGLEELKDEISRQLAHLQDKTADGIFRHYLDRSFTIQGHGTVVTGTVHSGSYNIGQSLWLHPAMKEVKIRSIQRHNNSVEEVFRGDRCSMNVTGIKKEEISSGMILSDTQLNKVILIDAELEVFGDVKPGEFWCEALFYTGSYQSRVKVSLLDHKSDIEVDDADYVDGELVNEKRFIQLHLESPFAVSFGDKFILRNTSDSHTIGGGTLLDPMPLHHKRRRKSIIENLERISNKGLAALLSIKIHEAAFMKSGRSLARDLNLSLGQIVQAIDEGISRIAVLKGTNDTYLIPKLLLKVLKKDILKAIDDYHIVNYLKEDGMSLDEIAPKFRSYNNDSTDTDFIKQVLNNLCKEELLISRNGTWCAKSREIFADGDLEKKVSLVRRWYSDLGFFTHSQRNLIEDMEKVGLDEELTKKIVIFLMKDGWLTRFEEVYLISDHIQTVRKTMLSYLLENNGLTVASFRDLIEGNRKMCLACFSIFEKERIVTREGDDRVLTQKGRQLANELKDQTN